MQFSGSVDWCILVVHHTDMPTSQYPLQRAGVDVEHPDFPISTRYRDEVPIHAHVFYAFVITATNNSFRSASLHIVHMNLVPLNFGSEHLVLLCSNLHTSTEKPTAAADSRSVTPAVSGRLQGGVRAALSLREVSLRNAQSAHTGQLVAAMPLVCLARHNRPQRSGRTPSTPQSHASDATM